MVGGRDEEEQKENPPQATIQTTTQYTGGFPSENAGVAAFPLLLFLVSTEIDCLDDDSIVGWCLNDE